MSERLTVEWRNLTYLVEKKDDRFWNVNAFKKSVYTAVLHGVSGRIEGGSLTAILGASGAGKTTLLASISQRIRGNFSGEIAINGRLVSRDEMTKLSGFVSQYDISIASLTTREHLYFMCELKMDKTTNKYVREGKIKNLLKKFGLAACEHTKVSMLSGGEKRKLNLATELIREPQILFCDEPTTGLDSYNALSVVRTLKELAIDTRMASDEDSFPPADMTKYFPLDSAQMELLANDDDSMNNNAYRCKKAILCSIHQPTSEVFEYFSHIILMSSGCIIFQGTTLEAATFFSSLGLNCPNLYNPAEFYIQIMAGQFRGDNKAIDIKDIHQQFNTKFLHDLETTVFEESQGSESSLIAEQHLNQCSWFYQLYILMLRAFIDTRRNYRTHLLEGSLLMVTLCFMIDGELTAFTIVMLYGSVKPTTQTAIQDIRGAIFIITTEVLFTFTYCVMWIIPAQLPLLRREIGEKIYRLSAFYVSKVLLLLFPLITYSFVFMGIIYVCANFIQGFQTYLNMSISLVVSGVGAMAYGCLISCFIDSPRLITEITGPIDVMLMLMAGVYISVKSLPYVKYISFFFYANETISIDYWTTVGEIVCNENDNFHCLRNGTEVLDWAGYKLTRDYVYLDYLGMMTISLICHLVAYMGVRRYIRKAGFY